jgi:hypothetical protein
MIKSNHIINLITSFGPVNSNFHFKDCLIMLCWKKEQKFTYRWPTLNIGMAADMKFRQTTCCCSEIKKYFCFVLFVGYSYVLYLY